MNARQRAHFLNLTGINSVTVSIRALVDMFIQHNIDDELSRWTISTRKSHLSQFVTFCQAVGVDDIQLLNNHFIDEYFIQFRQSHGASTTNTSKRIMKVFLTWVRDYKEVDSRIHPEAIKSVKTRNKKPKAIDRPIIAKVIRECPVEQDRLIIATFVEAGVRISELINIKVSDVRGDSLDIHGKGNIERTVEITERLAGSLRMYIATHNRQPDDYLFQNLRAGYGDQLTKDTVWRHVKKWFKLIGGIEMHPHQLRHSFALNLLENGCDIVTIKELLGHEDINTTMVYLRITDHFRKQKYKTYIGESLMA